MLFPLGNYLVAMTDFHDLLEVNTAQVFTSSLVTGRNHSVFMQLPRCSRPIMQRMVFSECELTFTFAICYRLSVCLSIWIVGELWINDKADRVGFFSVWCLPLRTSALCTRWVPDPPKEREMPPPGSMRWTWKIFITWPYLFLTNAEASVSCSFCLHTRCVCFDVWFWCTTPLHVVKHISAN